MIEVFDAVFAFVIAEEGQKLTNTPGDAGGLTKFGIDAKDNPGVDIAALTLDAAKAIYLKQWGTSLASGLPWPICLVHFDAAVNCGESEATKFLQRSVGAVADGVFGPKSQAALADKLAGMGPFHIGQGFNHWRRAYYHQIVVEHPTNAQFLPDWLQRVADVNACLTVTPDAVAAEYPLTPAPEAAA